MIKGEYFQLDSVSYQDKKRLGKYAYINNNLSNSEDLFFKDAF